MDLGEPALAHLVGDERHRLGQQAAATAALGVLLGPAELADLGELAERLARTVDDVVVARVIAGVVVVDRLALELAGEVRGRRCEHVGERDDLGADLDALGRVLLADRVQAGAAVDRDLLEAAHRARDPSRVPAEQIAVAGREQGIAGAGLGRLDELHALESGAIEQRERRGDVGRALVDRVATRPVAELALGGEPVGEAGLELRGQPLLARAETLGIAGERRVRHAALSTAAARPASSTSPGSLPCSQ